MIQLVHFSHPEWMYDNVLMLDVVERAYRNGDIVKILVCDSTIKICSANLKSEKMICLWCKYYRKKLFRDLSNDIEILDYGDFYSIKDKSTIDTLSFDYNSISNIKNLTYRGVKIGFGALSSYVSITRNLYPKIDDKFKNYFNLYLRSEVVLVEILGNVLNKINPDLVSLYNGRFFETRPVFEVSRNLGYSVRCYENRKTTDFTHRYLVFSENMLPHDQRHIGESVNKIWENANLSENERQDIGESFFTNRRNAVFAGDTIYIKDQQRGVLPLDWNISKKNIAIFMSSEDELYALGGAYEKNMFDSQYEGIVQILKCFMIKKEFHFYLRIHPNLENVKYKYHTILLSLEQTYANITVIKADDKVSSYALLDNTEKTVVFGSTMGIEACFWRKPVILLGSAFYQNLDICYTPDTLEDTITLIKDANLQAKNREDAIKYGFYTMFPWGEDPLYFDFNLKFKYFNFLNKKIMLLNYCPVKYSLLALSLVRKFLNFFNRLAIYNPIKIPLDEN